MRRRACPGPSVNGTFRIERSQGRARPKTSLDWFPSSCPMMHPLLQDKSSLQTAVWFFTDYARGKTDRIRIGPSARVAEYVVPGLSVVEGSGKTGRPAPAGTRHRSVARFASPNPCPRGPVPPPWGQAQRGTGSERHAEMRLPRMVL